MKHYNKLPIPKSTAWDKKPFRDYIPTPVWFRRIINSIRNLIDWFPVIWNDRHWDGYYILKTLQRKVELQRSYLVKNNRHTRVDEDNYWMTIILNLIERELEDYYEMEYLDYEDTTVWFEKIEGTNYSEMKQTLNWEHWDYYLNKYPSTLRRVLKRYPDKSQDKKFLCIQVSMENQKKCRNLIFEIMKQHYLRWWD